ncbi:thioester-containing protein 1 allele R1-like isoform X2 [Lutzomyia longipalpis]|uniref:thioester-containing protein 1 allele R1-like isoform X2 n=1 Tax=Lutzomyia longipalpis TaxID=7200 RepID=UPI0024845565|nr:thioester-containing protein 1 allele R1-like isoform X2 [Lutzomyia longipalpis]
MSRFFAILLILGLSGGWCDAKGYYTIVGSRIFRANSPYHVSVSTHDTSEAVQMRIGVEGESEGGAKFSQFKDVTLEPDTSKVVEIDIGKVLPGQYNLTAEGLSGLIFKNFTSISANTKTFSAYIQTDKAVYKPGDTIRYRVLLLDANLKPVVPKEKMQIFIQDAKQNRIKQWLDAQPVKGVYSNELQLSDLPVLGDWTIQVEVMGQKFTKNVEVAEYVLPKFEVTIDAPQFATFKDGKLRFTVRSKYTYGKPVKGEATISVYPRFFGSYQPFVQDLISRKVAKIDGKASVEFDIKDELKFMEDWQRDITVEAIVEEELTNRKQNTSRTVTLYRTRYEVELIKSADKFKAGLPFTVRVKVAHRDGSPVTDKNNPVYIRQTNNLHSSDGFKSETINSTVYLDENGMGKINVAIPTNVSNIDMVATYLDTEGYLGYTPSVASDSNTFLKTTINTAEPEVNREISVQVDSTEPMTHFTYQVIGRGDIIVSKTVEVPSRTSHTFKFLASFAMVPEAKLIVYFVRSDGEIVSDSQPIKFRSSFQNFVKLELDKTQAGPGDDISIVVNSKPNSFVGLLGVDQSVLLLKSGNDLSKDDIFNDLRSYQEESWYNPHYPVWRKKRFIAPWLVPQWRDFSDSGAVLLTNAKEEARPFGFYGPFMSIAAAATSSGMVAMPGIPGPPMAAVSQFHAMALGGFANPPKIRKEFPESWIWENLNDNGYEGKTTLHKKVPDTITSWVITGFAIDPLTGFGMTQNPRTLKVFQPFFVSTNLPYSVKRGEVVSIPIVVFNYMESDVNAEVTLENVNQEFDFTEVANEVNPSPKLELYRKKRVSVPANGGKALSFMITPKKVGQITIKVTATSAVAGDGVERMLLVEPEGVPQFMSKAVFMDLNKNPEATASLPFEVPKNAVPDSVHVEVSVLGDLLGSTIENLDKLIRLPFGCGEQNMLNFVPNIVVLNYLKITGKQTPEIEKKALKYMESGYQRELTYKHKDGSFSAFGESDKSGSTWLTAFVARSFRQAKKFISVEEDVIINALNWLSDQQAPNGSFPEVGHVSHKDMQGGAGDGIALTAYTLITFLENRNDVPRHQNTINKAMDYIVRNLEGLDDVYALALATYALHIAQHSSRSNALGLLEAKATTEAQQKWWHKPIPEADKKNPYYFQPNSVNVELTSYALLTYLEAGIVEDSLPLVKWLIGQRNSEGGFQSTQDTVVGITALAKFAEKVSGGSGGDSDLSMDVTAEDGQKSNIRVNRDNSLVLQSVKLAPTVRNVTVSAKGKGFAVVQLSYRYNLNVTGAWPRFTLDPQVNKNSNQDFLHLSVCTSFIPDGPAGNESNMAVMEVAFPSGFTADLDTLPSLQALEKVKKVETKEGDTKVVLYFDNLDRQERCPTLTAFRTFKVAHQKPAAVTVYDYYDNARRARQFYSANPASLCDICEGDDCGDSCTPKAQQQTSGREPGSPLDNPSAVGAASAILNSFAVLIVCSLLARFL